jgi:hypothetical protein
MSQGPIGPQGPQGQPGGTGVTGFQGIQGPQGPPYGPQGPGFYSSSTRLNISNISNASSIAFSSATTSYYYNITSTAPVVNAISFSGTATAGMFWVFRNNTSNMITIPNGSVGAITNVVYNGNNTGSYTGPFYIGSGNSLTLVSNGGTTFIAF